MHGLSQLPSATQVLLVMIIRQDALTGQFLLIKIDLLNLLSRKLLLKLNRALLYCIMTIKTLRPNQSADDHDSRGPITSSPPRYKMAIVTMGVIFVLLNSVLPLVGQLTFGIPNLLSTFVTVVIIVLLMTYVIMPPLTRLLGPWLTDKR
jgi:antibiotic biosynthesis monooxygenase (ABM) superfamily enzyme